jgi:hypothetical protein
VSEREDQRREDDPEERGTFYAREKEADEAADEIGRRQGPGAESPGTGQGGPGSTSHKSRGG